MNDVPATPTILGALTTLFRDVFDDPDLVLTPETVAEDVEGWDSAAHVALVVEVERSFGIKFRTAEIEELRNVGDFASLIAQKTGRG